MELSKKQQRKLNEASQRLVGYRIALDRMVDCIGEAEMELFKTAKSIATQNGEIAVSIQPCNDEGEAEIIIKK